MKKIIIIFLFFPLISFAKEWPWAPVKNNARSVPIAKIACPATIQCNFDYQTENIPCVNSENTKYWTKKTTIQRNTKEQQGIINIPFIRVELSNFLSKDKAYENRRFKKAVCLYSLDGNVNYEYYATLRSVDVFSFEQGQETHGINIWWGGDKYDICRSDDGSKDPSNPNNCSVFVYNAHRASS